MLATVPVSVFVSFTVFFFNKQIMCMCLCGCSLVLKSQVVVSHLA